MKYSEQIAQEMEARKSIDKTDVMYDETWEDYMRGGKMTRKEAIENIKELIDTYITCHGEEDTVAVSLDNVDVEALDMAIKALQESILDKVKQAREEIDSKYDDFANSFCEGEQGRNEMIEEVLEILDKLIAESER